VASIDPRVRPGLRLAPLLAGAIAFLAAGHLVFTAVDRGLGTDALWGLSLSSESGIGTWASALLLAAVAGVCFCCGAVAEGSQRRGFRILGAAVLMLSIDEVAAQHEHVGRALRESLDLSGFFYYAWMVPALVIVVVFLVWQWRFFRSLEPALQQRLLLAAALYVGGAVGLEFIESKLMSDAGEASLVYDLLVLVEETLELVAAAVVLVTLADHLARRAPRWSLVFGPGTIALGPAGATVPAAASPERVKTAAVPAGGVDRVPDR
jgi:hypothetical protein